MNLDRTVMLRGLLCVMLVCGAGAAYADNGLFYVGAGISKAQLSDISSGGVPLHNLDNTSWKIYAGVRPISVVGVEADYLDLGSQTTRFVSNVSVDAKYKAFAAYGVGYLPIPVPYLDVFGKIGVARWDSSGGTGIPGGGFFSLSDHGTDFAWGAGAQAHIGNIGGRLEYEGFRIPSTNNARVFSLSVYLNLM